MSLPKDKAARQQRYADTFAHAAGAGQAHTEHQRGQIARKVLGENFDAAIGGFLSGDLSVEDLQADLRNLAANAPLIADYIKTGTLATPVVVE